MAVAQISVTNWFKPKSYFNNNLRLQYIKYLILYTFEMSSMRKNVKWVFVNSTFFTLNMNFSSVPLVNGMPVTHKKKKKKCLLF